LRPEATVADGAPAQRAAQELVLPGVVCRGDVFHPFSEELVPLVRTLENRAYRAIAACSRLEAQLARPVGARKQSRAALAAPLREARRREAAIPLAEEVALLVRWLRADVGAVAGPELAVRRELYDLWSSSCAHGSRATPGWSRSATRWPTNGTRCWPSPGHWTGTWRRWRPGARCPWRWCGRCAPGAGVGG